jgi:DNA-binding ferritin-like protein
MSQNTTDKQAYLNATPMQREVVRRLLCDVLGCLRAQYLSYQTSHWMVVGGSFYGNHLLFQRLYESVRGQVDQLAEKISGYLGSEAVALNHQMRHISDYTYSWSAIGCNHKRGLQSEADLQQALKRAYDGIKQAQAMSLGLDDWIMATANAHEENEYLLQQALAPIPGEGKQAARQPRSRTDLIGYFYALHDALEKEFNYSAEQIEGMTNAWLRRRTKQLSDSLARTDAGADGAVERAMGNAPAAYKQLSRITGGKLASTVSIADVERFVKRLRTYMDVDRKSQRSLHLITRESGDVGEEEPGEADFDEARRVARAVAKEFGRDAFKMAMDGMDEWVTLDITLKGRKYGSDAPSAEGDFYKAPNKREVLEFARSKAISNSVAVAEKASEKDHLDIPEKEAVAEAREAPLLPTEIVAEPGGKAVSTLNRYVLQSEDPVAEQAVKMNEARMAAWRKELD